VGRGLRAASICRDQGRRRGGGLNPITQPPGPCSKVLRAKTSSRFDGMCRDDPRSVVTIQSRAASILCGRGQRHARAAGVRGRRCPCPRSDATQLRGPGSVSGAWATAAGARARPGLQQRDQRLRLGGGRVSPVSTLSQAQRA
jgi:hypothetical protein